MDSIIQFVVSTEWLFIPLLAATVFFIVFLNADKVLNFLYARSLGGRQEIIDKLKMMFVEVDKKQITWVILLISYGLGFLIFLALWPNIVPGFIFGAVFTVVGWSLPKLIVNSLWEQRCSKFTNQMVDGLTIMGNGVKAGLSVSQAMERVVSNMTGPIAQEFALVLNKIQLGMSVEDALNELGERIPRQDVQMFVMSINILKETGGNLAETFETIVMTVRERQKIEKKIEALTAQGTMQAIIITLVPFILLVVFMVIDPNYVLPLFTRPLGWFALAIMIGLQVIGGVMMKKIVTIKV